MPVVLHEPAITSSLSRLMCDGFCKQRTDFFGFLLAVLQIQRILENTVDTALASSWPTKGERRLVGNAVKSINLIILSSECNPVSENRLFISSTNCDSCLSLNFIVLSAGSFNS